MLTSTEAEEQEREDVEREGSGDEMIEEEKEDELREEEEEVEEEGNEVEEEEEGNEEEEEEGEGLEGETGLASPPVSLNQKLKKPCSAWIIYSTENRSRVKAEHPEYTFKDIASALSSGFKNLSDQERKVYIDKAQEQKEQYAKDLAEQKRLLKLYGPPSLDNNEEKHFKLSSEAIFPLARVKRCMKLDPEVKNIKPEAAVATSKMLELFLAYAAVRAGRIASSHNRKTVKASDLVSLVNNNSMLSFLKMDFPAQDRKQTKKRPVKTKHQDAQPEAKVSKITGFFGQK